MVLICARKDAPDDRCPAMAVVAALVSGIGQPRNFCASREVQRLYECARRTLVRHNFLPIGLVLHCRTCCLQPHLVLLRPPLNIRRPPQRLLPSQMRLNTTRRFPGPLEVLNRWVGAFPLFHLSACVEKVHCPTPFFVFKSLAPHSQPQRACIGTFSGALSGWTCCLNVQAMPPLHDSQTSFCQTQPVQSVLWKFMCVWLKI